MTTLNPNERRQVRRLAGLGARELIRLAESGRLSCASIWMALKSAQCFRRAIADHGLAPARVQQIRLAVCQSCPSAVVGRRGRLTSHRIVSCGVFHEEHLDADPPTCGCIVAMVDHKGNWTPAGKGVVARGATITVGGSEVSCSAECPQGRF